MISIYFLNSVKKIFAFNILFIGLIYSFGQTIQSPSYSANVFPSHPDQSGLLRVAEQSVSASTGIPDTNIPLYTIREGDIIYPLQLNYNSEGIRVNEIASSVGMGWNLSVPQIIRSTRGIPDDVVNGFLSTTETVQSVKNLFESCNPSVDPVCNSMMVDIERRSKSGALDLESDIYTVILPSGKSIQFMFNQNRSTANPKGEIVTFPKSYVKIIPNFSGRNIVSWKVIDIDGIEYNYGGLDRLYSKRSYVFGSDLPTLGVHNSNEEHNTGWNIQSIRDTKGRQVNFEYETINFSNCDFVNQTRSYAIDFDDVITTNQVKTVGIKDYLKKISGNFGEILFDLENREDYNGGKRIKQMVVKFGNEQIKKVVFDYYYTTSTNPFHSLVQCDQILNYNDPTILELKKRLFLQKVNFYDKINSEKQTYELEYNSTVIDDRFANSQDWWGFYNGKSNVLLVPGFNNSQNIPNRQIDVAKSQAGILKKIKYPTGGFSEFEYENNRGVIFEPPGAVTSYSLIPTQPCLVEIDQTWGYYTEGIYDYVYEQPFEVKDVVNYYSESDGNLYVDLWMTAGGSSNCVYDGDWPTEGGCKMRAELTDLDTNEIIHAGYIANHMFGGSFLPLKIGIANPFQLYERNLMIKVKVIKGSNSNTHPPYNPITDYFYVTLSWNKPDSELVRNLGNSLYEIPVGGLRAKSITTKENATTPLTKRTFSYKNEEDIESANYNVNLNYWQRFAPGVTGFNSINTFPLQMGGSRTVIYENFKESYEHIYNNLLKIEKNTQNVYMMGVKNGGCHYIGSNSFFSSRSTPCFQHPQNGLPAIQDLQSKKTTVYEYNSNGGINNPSSTSVEGIDFNTIILGGEDMHNGNPENVLPFHEFFYYKIYQFYDEPVKKVTTTTHLNQDVIETVKTKYHQLYSFLPIETEQQNSLGETLKTEYQYPQDLPSKPLADKLIAANRIAEPLVVKTYNGSTLLSEQETLFKEFTVNENPIKKLVLPEFVYHKKGTNPSEKKITYDRYDTYGNLQQYHLADGTPVSIIWGYNGQYPIVKVEGVAYADIEILAIALANNNNLTESSFDSLRTLVNHLTDNSKFGMLTCYIYEPLVGVKMIIQPNGQKEIYEYDSAGRLMKVKDHEGKELKKFDYHYSTQP